MATITTTTPEGVRIELELAGAGSRFAAALVDLGLFGVGFLGLAAFFWIVSQVDFTGGSGLVLGVLFGGMPFGMVLYQFAFLALTGSTPGKRLLGLRVVAQDGRGALPLALLLRSLFWPIDALLLPIPIGIVAIAVGRSRQRLGDLIAGTTVVSDERESVEPEPFPNETWSGLETKTLNLVPGLAARFDDDDLEFLRGFWARSTFEARERRRLAIVAARHYAERLELGRFDDARVVLRELYLFLRESRAARRSGVRVGTA